MSHREQDVLFAASLPMSRCLHQGSRRRWSPCQAHLRDAIQRHSQSGNPQRLQESKVKGGVRKDSQQNSSEENRGAEETRTPRLMLTEDREPE